MTVAEAVHRGYNLLAVVLLGVLGAGFADLIFGEIDPVDKFDNAVLLAIGVAAVAWYLLSRHPWQRSVVPVVLAGVALAGQAGGIALEIGDAQAVGDDFGGLTLYAIALVVLASFYVYNRRFPSQELGSRAHRIQSVP